MRSTTRAALEGIAAGLELALSSVRAVLEQPDPGEWVSQKDSPLGRRKHCRLVRQGKLPGYRVERDIYVQRADLDAFIRRHPVVGAGEPEDEQQAARVAEILKRAQATPTSPRRKPRRS